MLTRYSVYCSTENNMFNVWSLTKPNVCPSDGSLEINVVENMLHRLSVSSIEIDSTDSPYIPSAANVINCDTSSDNITINLPKCRDGLYSLYSIVKTSNLNVINVIPDDSDTIYNIIGNKVLTDEGNILTIVSDGISNWTYIDTYDLQTIQTSINNIKLNTKLTYVTVSNDPNNPGDYRSISDAFSNGETSVFVKSGVYNETNEIIIPDKGKLIGENDGSVNIIGSVRVDAFNGVIENIGRISISNNTNTVVGVGTRFTNLAPKDSILIANNYMDILSIEDDNNLTLEILYRGKDINNNSYIAQKMYTGITLSDFIISNSSSFGLYIRGLKNSIIKNISSVSSSLTNFHFVDCYDCKFSNITSISSSQQGILCDSCIDIHIESSKSCNNFSSGISINNSNFVILDKCSCKSNNYYGFEIDNCSNINILESIGNDNNNKGIMINSQLNTIRGCTFSDNNGEGIEINGNSNNISMNIIKKNVGNGIVINSDFCNLIGNNCTENILNGIYIIGKNTNLSFNKIMNNSNGINILGDNCNIIGNIVTENNNGIMLSSESRDNMINNNQIITNANNNLVDDGTNNIQASNLVL